MEDKTDSELVWLAQAGDKAAFGQLVERYGALARHIALGMVAHEEIARELAQEAILQAYLSLQRLRDGARFRSWLYGIMLNVCRSYLRDQHAQFFSLEAMAGGLVFDAISFAGPIPSPQEIIEARELQRLVLAAVNALSPAEREATLLFYYDQLTLQESAAVLGISLTAVKGRLHKSRKHLREQLLPLYAEFKPMVSGQERSKKMIKVSVADVVHVQRTGEAQEQRPPYNIIVLHDDVGCRALPIWVGPWEAESIAIRLGSASMPRPMTYTFVANLLDAAGVSLEEVRVESLKEDTFYGIAKIRSNDAVREIDCRPSDAIALAVHTGRPIYVADEVMDRAGVAIPEHLAKLTPEGRTYESLVAGAQNLRQVAPRQWSPEEVEKSRQELIKSRQELIAHVFGE